VYDPRKEFQTGDATRLVSTPTDRPEFDWKVSQLNLRMQKLTA
jgi:hypothetical protein